MGAVAFCARVDLRCGMRSWLALALLIGLVAGTAFAAAAGARRTDSAHPRFLDRHLAADVLLDNYPDPGVATVDPAAVQALPQVASSVRAAYLFIGETGALAPVDDGLGHEINRPKVLSGRLAAPGRVDEIVVGFERARTLRWRVGTTVPLIERRYEAEARRAGVPNVRLRVVGIVASPGDFPPLATGEPSIYLTPAFHRAYARTPLLREGAGQAVLARLVRGRDDVAAFRKGVERLTRGRPNAVTDEAQRTANTGRSLQLQATALWILAAILAATGVVVVSQALSRLTLARAGELTTLHALGMTPRQLFALGLLRALAVGTAGAVVAAATAVALSPLTPIGDLARTIEPDPGVAIDKAVLAVGVPGTVLLVTMLAAPAAWRATHAAPRRPAAAPAARARATDLLARLGGGTAVVTGVRMALEPGRERTSIPVRTAILGVTVGVTGLAAALTFAASSSHLLDTPRLYGWNWDAALTTYGSGSDLGKRHALFARDPGIAAVAIGDLGIPLDVNGVRLGGVALESVRGRVMPPVTDGRAPAAPGEVMLGAKTLRTLDVRIGDTVTVRRPGARSARMRIVGQGVLGTGFSNTGRLGQGAVIDARDARRLAPGTPASDAVVRLAPGTDARELQRRLSRRLGPLYLRPHEQPSDIVDFGRVRALPLLLAGLLALLATATLAHVLIASVRRRARDIAVLKTLGFQRRDVRLVVQAQSLTYTAAALLIGLPLGTALGRLLWNVYADHLGIVPDVVVPLGLLLIVIPAATLIALLVAVLPARRAAATQPAADLRAG